MASAFQINSGTFRKSFHYLANIGAISAINDESKYHNRKLNFNLLYIIFEEKKFFDLIYNFNWNWDVPKVIEKQPRVSYFIIYFINHF